MLPVFISSLVWLASPARATAPAGRYVVAGGTVLDTKTNLTWQQTASSTKYDGKFDAICTALGAGWRVPTIRELVTIVDYSRATSPKIDTSVFLGTQSGSYWSATWAPWWPGYTTLSFDTGTTGANDQLNANYLRCVR